MSTTRRMTSATIGDEAASSSSTGYKMKPKAVPIQVDHDMIPFHLPIFLSFFPSFLMRFQTISFTFRHGSMQVGLKSASSSYSSSSSSSSSYALVSSNTTIVGFPAESNAMLGTEDNSKTLADYSEMRFRKKNTLKSSTSGSLFSYFIISSYIDFALFQSHSLLMLTIIHHVTETNFSYKKFRFSA